MFCGVQHYPTLWSAEGSIFGGSRFDGGIALSPTPALSPWQFTAFISGVKSVLRCPLPSDIMKSSFDTKNCAGEKNARSTDYAAQYRLFRFGKTIHRWTVDYGKTKGTLNAYSSCICTACQTGKERITTRDVKRTSESSLWRKGRYMSCSDYNLWARIFSEWVVQVSYYVAGYAAIHGIELRE